MPAYFTLSIQRKTDKLTHDYVEKMYSAIIASGYPYKSGFWFHKDASFPEIIEWNQTKLEKGFRLGSTEHGSHNYMQILFDATMYHEMRGYWMHRDTEIDFHLLIPESDILNFEGGDIFVEELIAPIRKLGVAIWENDLADVIQTSLELDDFYFRISEVQNGKNVMTRPFAIIPKLAITAFDNDYFSGKVITEVGNNGAIISNGNNMDIHL